MGYHYRDMRIEFGPKPSRESFNPTAQQIKDGNLGAVKPTSSLGEFMIRARDPQTRTAYQQVYTSARDAILDTSSTLAERTKKFVQDAGPAAAVVGTSLALAAVAGCAVDLSGDVQTDGGAGDMTEGGADARVDNNSLFPAADADPSCVTALHQGDQPTIAACETSGDIFNIHDIGPAGGVPVTDPQTAACATDLHQGNIQEVRQCVTDGKLVPLISQ